MYCVIANIDSKFRNLQEAQAVYNTFTPVISAPPEVRDPMKDVTKQRTLVACIVEHCVTALGVRHTFFRCTSFDDKIPSCATEGLEVYPVVVLTFSDTQLYHKPFLAEAPDCDISHEMWLMESAIPITVELRWLGANAIHYQEAVSIGVRTPVWECIRIGWVDELLSAFKHPWLNGRGQVLSSTETEDTSY